MNTINQQRKSAGASRMFPGLVTLLAVASLLLAACATGPEESGEVKEVREKLTQLQSDTRLAGHAPVAMKEAEDAVRAAEDAPRDAELSQHLVFMADGKIELARARAETSWQESQRDTLREQREQARLDARTREVQAARSEADELREQMADLNSRQTERGMVVTLGDLLFETGKAELKGGAERNLAKLATFLREYPDRTAIIEGHTDNVGGADYNLGLSQRRAEAVRDYLVREGGVQANRLTTEGKGMDDPIADNNTASGRAQNRRVEVIISNKEA